MSHEASDHKQRGRLRTSHTAKVRAKATATATAAATRKDEPEPNDATVATATATATSKPPCDRPGNINALRRARLAYLETAPEERRATMKYVYERPVKVKDKAKAKTKTQIVRPTTRTRLKMKTKTRPSTGTGAGNGTTRRRRPDAGADDRDGDGDGDDDGDDDDDDNTEPVSDDGDYVYGRPEPSKDKKEAKARTSTSRRKATSTKATSTTTTARGAAAKAKATAPAARPQRRHAEPLQRRHTEPIQRRDACDDDAQETVVTVATPSRPPPKRRATSTTRTAANTVAASAKPAASTASRKPSGGLASLFYVAPPPPERRVSCLTCGDDDVRLSKTAKLPCKHRMCHACLRRIFRLSITDPAHMPPRCCTDDHIALKHVEKLFDNDFKKTFNRKYLEYTANNRIYCVNRACGQWIRPKDITTEHGRKIAKCKKCGTLVCATCNNKAHRSRDCPKDPDTRQFIETAKQKGWQKCYNCSAMVELKEGCNHMTCRCTAEFCMVCGLKWKSCDCAWFNYVNVDAHLGNPVRYQQEMDRRRDQEQRDEALARRMQALGLGADDARGAGAGVADNQQLRDVFGLGNAAGHHMNANFIQQARDALTVNFQNAEHVARGLLNGWMGGRENPLPAGIPGTIEDELNDLLGRRANDAAAADHDVNDAPEPLRPQRRATNRRRRHNLRDDIVGLDGRDPQEQAQTQEQEQERQRQRQREWERDRDQERRIQDWANAVPAPAI